MDLNRRIVKPVVALVVGVIGIIAPFAAGAAVAHGQCSNAWGSLAKEGPTESRSTLANVRSGRHECFDRLVIDLDDGTAGYKVQYLDEVIEDGRGNVVPLRGGAFLEVRVHAPAHDDDGNATYSPRNKAEAVSVSGYRTFRQVSFVGSFEGDTQLGLGVRARLPFNTFVIDTPGDGSRLVVDVAHSWPAAPKPAPTTTVQAFFGTGDGGDCSQVSAFPRTAPRTKAPIRLSLDQVVGGPTSAEIAQGAGSMFSSATADSIKSIKLSNGLLVVDFKDFRQELNNASTSCGSEALLAQLNSTVFQFGAVQKVRYQIEGSCDTFSHWLQGDCTDYSR